MHKINSDHTAAVAQDFFWIPISETPPPQGVKLLLININAGIAQFGTLKSGDDWYTHWQALPKFKK
jgi:hypothetical protein